MAFAIFLIPAQVRSQELAHSLKHDADVAYVALSKDNALIAVGCDRLKEKPGSITFWDTKTGKQIMNLIGHDSCAGLAFIDDDRCLISAGFGTVMRVNKVSNGEEVCRTETLRTLTNLIPIGRTNTVATWEDGLRIWDVSNPKAPHPLKNQPDYGRCSQLDFSPDGRFLVKAANEGSTDMFTTVAPDIQIWQVPNGGKQKVFKGEIRNNVTCIRLSPDNKYVAVGYFFGHANLEIREAASGRIILSGVGHRFPPVAIAFSSNGKYLATGDCFAGDLVLWDIEKKTVKKKTEGAHSGSIQSLAFNHDGTVLVSGGSDRVVRLWKCAGLK